MKAIALILAIQFLWSLSATADGLPYSISGSLHCEAVILHMDEDQFKQVDTLRTVALTKEQRAMLSRLFKTLPESLTVVSSSFNDNREEATQDEVYCIWLRDTMLAVTYDAEYAAREPNHYREQAGFISVADPDRLVVSSESKIYKDGKEISVKEIYQMIDALAVITAKEKPGFYIDLRFSMPPKVKNDEERRGESWKLLDAFRIYGEAKGVVVAATW